MLSTALTLLTAEVAANRTVVESAVTLLNGLTDALHQALESDDEEAIQGLVTELQAQTAVLANAVAANTPADPEPVVEPVLDPAADPAA
jgi:hypothetical protein